MICSTTTNPNIIVWASPKDPDERLDYVIDWTARLDPQDVILTSVFSVVEGTVEIDTQVLTGAQAIVWLVAGQNGERCPILNRITTQGGRQMEQTVYVVIQSK